MLKRQEIELEGFRSWPSCRYIYCMSKTDTASMVEALEGLRDWDIKNGHGFNYGYTAQDVAGHLMGDMAIVPGSDRVKAAKRQLEKAERRGEIASVVVRVQGRGRKGTVQTYKLKFYSIVRSA